MSTRGRDFLVGGTAIIGLLGLAGMLMAFGELRFRAPQQYQVFLNLPDAGGLNPAGKVFLNGVRVGTIASTRNQADPRDGVVVTLDIQKGVNIPADVQVIVNRDFVGNTSLSLATRPGVPGSAAAALLRPGDSFSGTASGLLDQIGGMLDSRLSQFNEAAKSIQRLGDTYVELGQQLKGYVEPRALADVEAGRATPNVASTIERLDRAIRNAEAWLGDEQIRRDVKNAVARAGGEGGVLEQLNGAVGSWTKAADSLSRNADRVGDNLDTTVKEFAQATRTLNNTLQETQKAIAQMNAGQGTLGLLLTNPDLYRSLTDASRRLEKALAEAQLLLEKYRKEGIPIQF
ncbi:MAG: MCE family protein [Phycisphaerales bacterium]|nr:MCE family protein [Phycisphaerales bacterium]